MKKVKYIILIAFLITISCKPQSYYPINEMTKELWEEDINYLNKKIQSEFQTYNTSVKDSFNNRSLKLTQQLDELNNTEIAIRISQLVAGLLDGHTEITLLQSNANLDRIPMAFYFFKDGLYIFGAHEKYKNLIGFKVNKIGSKTTEEIFELLKTVLPHDNEYEILHTGPSVIALSSLLEFLNIIPNSSKVPIQLTNPDGKLKLVEIKPISLTEYKNGNWKTYTELYSVKPILNKKNRDKDYWYEYLENSKSVYFNYGKTNDQKGQPSIKKVIKEMFTLIDNKNPEKLIIDLRQNRGGNYNKSKPLIEAIKKRDFLNKKGKIYVITGRTTFSAAMVTTVFLKKETRAIIVGEPSRGHPNKTDNVEYLNLPNSGLKMEYTTKVKKHWPELGDSDKVPVDIKIDYSFIDYKTGNDPALQYILNEKK